MPHITVRGLEKGVLKEISLDLKKIVVEVSKVEERFVKVFYSGVERVDEPTEVAVDVYWMHRPQEMCDELAHELTECLKQKGNDFVQVTFTEFPGNLFYENDSHY